MKLATPNKKLPGKGASTSGSKKKQMSLMSFFKPTTASPSTKTDSGFSSSPLKGKNDKREISSDQEGDITMVDAGVVTDTPMTSDSEVLQQMTAKGDATPNDRESEHDNKQVKKDKDSNLASSPLVKRHSVNYAESEDEDEIIQKRKKRRRLVESEDEDDIFIPEQSEDEDEDHISDFVVDEKEIESEENSEPEDDLDIKATKCSKKSNSSKERSRENLTSQQNGNSIGNKFRADSSYVSNVNGKLTSQPKSPPKAQKKSFAKENEERYQWLVDIKDAEKRPVDDPNYDSRTLYVPQSAWSKFTPFEKQYWEIKSKMWDTVVFFKKGKFYELYENDAIIANTEFDLKIAGGGRANMKLAGIPEMSFEYWAKEFISHGYKVAKVDQKETLLAKEMRGGATKEEKVIKRELSGVLTGGTLTDLNMISDDMAIYCLSIKEEQLENGEKIFGVVFVDTATSELNFIEVRDDSECTKLDTLITQIKPKEIICEKGNLCSVANKILRYNGHNSNQIWNILNPLSEFWDYDITLENLVTSKYYEAEDLDDYSNYPEVLIHLKDNKKVAFSAFGGLLYYLKTLMLDKNIMTLGNIKEYTISKNISSTLILDGITLNNLEILNNSFDGGDRGTLFKLLNKAITPFGKRLLKQWVIHPLRKTEDINDRYDSVDYLMQDGLEFRNILEQNLSGLPDLERLLARIHAKSLRFKDFLRVIEGFEKISSLMKTLTEFSCENSGILNKYIKRFPNQLHILISEWEDAFDRLQALTDIIVPSKGVDKEFDESQGKIDDIEVKLYDYLKSYKKDFKSQEICFKDSGKEIFLIEVPNKLAKSIPHDWQQMGSTAKVKRYWSPEVRKLVRELLEQKELHKVVCDTLRSRMYDKFGANYSIWVEAVNVISSIDCLIALTKTSETIGFPSCRPKFMESESGFVDFKELRHPCFVGTKDFIPNDISLGGSNPNIGLLTGANAAGKSTIMRTTALAVILSQIGCYIPASLATLSPTDRIMTRLGANDNIMQGKSTFFVELSETKKILSNATSNSLVIIDELGRGGSSSDGYSIAESVLYQLATHIQAPGFFATHYGSLGLLFKNHPQIEPLRMAILIENSSRNITFLYKLEKGTAPGSFGMNVASMCGISDTIVDEAEIAAKEYEQTHKLKKDNQNQVKLSLGLQSDFSWLVNDKFNKLSDDILNYSDVSKRNALENIFKMIDAL